MSEDAVNVDDIIETANHFKCIDMVIEQAAQPLSQAFIKQLHRTLKSGTSDSRKNWFAIGEYKKLPNEVGGKDTAAPEEVSERLAVLLKRYRESSSQTLEDLIAFHYEFETIHPFQDGNGRVGRLILFKECLKYNIVPFIIDEDLKMFYYRGLHDRRAFRPAPELSSARGHSPSCRESNAGHSARGSRGGRRSRTPHGSGFRLRHSRLGFRF